MAKDYLDGDHSFKKWFHIMWKNGYIFTFFLGFGGMIAQLILWNDMIEMINDNFNDSTFGGVATIVGMLVPAAIAGLTVGKGFIQFWNDLKNGRSR